MKKASELTNLVYDMSDLGPFAKDFGLRDQIRRAAVSVTSNIAEGFVSQSNRMFVTYLYRAKGSAGEVRSQLYIALDRSYINEKELQSGLDKASKTSRLISGFISYLESTN